MQSRLIIGVAVAATLLLGACASTSTSSLDAAPTDGYRTVLRYPDRLRPVSNDAYALRWISPSADLRKYDKLLIERIRVRLDSSSSAADPNELKALTDYFQAALVKALSPPYTLVERDGPGVLRVRVTLVDLVSTKPEVSVAVLLTPYATIPDMMSGAATGRPVGAAPYLGQTGVAAEFIDGSTNEVIAEFADTRFGRKYVVNTSQGISSAVTGGISNYLDAYSSWAYAQQAFDAWAIQFRERWDQIQRGQKLPG